MRLALYSNVRIKFLKAYRDCVACSGYYRKVAMDLEDGEFKISGHDTYMFATGLYAG